MDTEQQMVTVYGPNYNMVIAQDDANRMARLMHECYGPRTRNCLMDRRRVDEAGTESYDLTDAADLFTTYEYTADCFCMVYDYPKAA